VRQTADPDAVMARALPGQGPPGVPDWEDARTVVVVTARDTMAATDSITSARIDSRREDL